MRFAPMLEVAAVRAHVRPMRRIRRRDWLALAAPATVVVVFGAAQIHDRGWLPGLAQLAAALAFGVRWWRRQISKHPDGT